MPTSTPNKVKFNLKNVYIASATPPSGSTGTWTYGTPQALPGAVSISLDAEGDNSPFYADDIVYYRTVANNGYTGELELAIVPDWFRKSYLNETEDNKGILFENANSTTQNYFAMLFEFAGDAHKIRHCLYKCSVSRPTISSQTKETSSTPVTETLNITCDPREDGLVKSRTGADADSTVYAAWFSSVYETATT